MADIEEVLETALQLGDDGRWEEMAELLAEVLEESPEDAYVLCWLGVAEAELGNDGSAYEYFKRCVAQDPLDPHLLAMAGAGLAAFDDPDAESVLRAAALTGPDLPMARLQYGSYLAREGLLEEALEHLRAAVTLAPDDAAIHGELAVALTLKGDLDAAIAEMETTLEIAPDDGWTRVLLGLLHMEQGRMEDAAEALIQAANEREEDAEAHLLAALIAATVGWDDAAQDALARAGLTIEPEDAELLEEVEDRVNAGAEASREFLLESFGPSVLRERLAHPV